MGFKFFSGFILTSLLHFGLLAQPGQYKFTRININHGLSHNQTNAILKDSQGFMWFGTMSGLNRYDGYSFKVFRHDIRDSASISNNNIGKITEGPDGKLWISTLQGLNIYDPRTETFYRNAGKFLKEYGIPDVSVTDIVQDTKGTYWFITDDAGLFNYSGAGKKGISFTHSPSDTATIYSNRISAMAEDPQGDFWIIHQSGVLEKMDGKTHKITYRNYDLFLKNYGKDQNYNVFVDADGDPWFFMAGQNIGVYFLENENKALLHIHTNSRKIKLNTNIVRSIAQDNKGHIWIGTDHGGINLLDKKNFTIRYILHREGDQKSISHNSIYTLYKDNTGIMWVGTFKKGVNYYHENSIKFPLYKHQINDPGSLSYDDINRIVEDNKGNLWIGTNGGGLIYFDRPAGKFSQFLHEPGNPNSLSSNIIVSLLVDTQQKLWIGTYFGGLTCFDGEKFIHYKNDPGNPESLADNSVWELFEDSQNNLWVGTLAGGLDRFDRNSNTFHHYRREIPNSISSNYVPVVIEDKSGKLWIGTSYGINVLDKKSGKITHYLNDRTHPNSLSNNNVIAMLPDSRGLIWIGTHEGLNYFDPEKNSFQVFREEDGLPHNTILAVREDNHQNLWVSTPNGLSQVFISKKGPSGEYSLHFKNYDESDGLQGKAFNEFAACKTRAGELIFGGANGFNIFHPDAIEFNKNIPQLVLTDFQLFNKSVDVGEKMNERAILEQSISQTREITLKPNEDVFSIEFAALSYFQPEKNKYLYKLEGFDTEWQATDGKVRKATYTNLDPGQYIFKVKAANNDGFWNEAGVNLKLNVLPPFWKTHTAIALYILSVIGALLLARRIVIDRARLNFRIEQERQEAQRMHELDRMKIQFFTNISHEFRTPLTLIITPLDKMMQQARNAELQGQLQLIQRNARRLLNMVNQLLDFRKMEVEEITLALSKGDIIKFVKELAYSFSDISERKNIRLSFHATVQGFDTFFDQDKLGKILFNLLSNAFKFTPEHGQVAVEVSLPERPERKENLQDETQTDEIQAVEIRVKDTGIGIPIEQHEKIFERFFQHDLPESIVNQGSGIGLAITKEFVKLHGGTITVGSEPGKGSCFTVTLPLRKIAREIPAGHIIEEEVHIPAEKLLHENGAGLTRYKHDSKKSLVLLIEDNEDFRCYLKDNLKTSYELIEAVNGKEGWKQAHTLIPDLIVSDVTMPEMDGIQLCRKIKSDPRTSHIPVILLTARSAEAQQLEGFQTGANDYITKPFSFDILQSRIRNLILQQESLQKAFQKKVDVTPSDIAANSLDEKLIQKALALVEKNMANADFSVEELSRELGISRVHFYKKILSLTGKTPIEFIRIIRLKRAAQLLERTQLTVSEIAYQVGFNNPKYFTKYFKIEFDVLPSMYAAEKKVVNEN